MDRPERPIIDYANLPYLPRCGITGDSESNFITRSLFLETAHPGYEDKAIWCLSEQEIYANGKWYPSAWMAYIYSIDEYDAIRKICGNVRQWHLIERMFKSVNKEHILQGWRDEQAMVQRSRLRELLVSEAESGGKGTVTAVKALLPMIDVPKGRGRPVKKKAKEDKTSAEAAASRVLDFQKAKNEQNRGS